MRQGLNEHEGKCETAERVALGDSRMSEEGCTTPRGGGKNRRGGTMKPREVKLTEIGVGSL